MNPANHQVSCYEILQLTPQAGDDDVKRAYRRLALRHHPDRHPRNKRVAELRFRLITEAYAQLNTVEKRRQYNHARFGTIPESNNDNHSEFTNPSWMRQFADIFRPIKNPDKKRI